MLLWERLIRLLGGGMAVSSNRTTWPVAGGALALQPGWFSGHSSALIYVNIAFGNLPESIDNPLVAPFQMVGPTNDPFPGTFCLPNVPIPPSLGAKVGDNATLQVIMSAQHGASLYNVSLPYFVSMPCLV